MSLVPYSPTDDSRSVVLRHRQTLVIYDPSSNQLVLHQASPSTSGPPDLPSCPFCKRPLDSAPAPGSPEAGGEGFVVQNYFQLLDDRNIPPNMPPPIRRTPPSPTHRSLPRPEVEDVGEDPGFHQETDPYSEPVGGGGISDAAFSPKYFERFFVTQRELGRGGKGVVLLVRHVLDGVSLGEFACKRVPVGDNHKWLEKVLKEVQLLQQLSHSNLVSYRHVWLESVRLTTFGPSVPCAFILQQYCNAGDLHDFILTATKKTTTEQLKDKIRRRTRGISASDETPLAPRRLAFEQIISFFSDIASGLNYLHSNGFIHRDLKPSNCLLNDTGIPGQELRVLVSDFGEVQMESEKRNSTGATGTISYCAPEVLRRVSPAGQFANFTTKSDVFSLGMILHFMCFGNLPYACADLRNEENENLDSLRNEILAFQGLDERTRLRSDLPERLYQSLKTLISPDPNVRPSAEEILLGLGGAIGEDPPIRRGSSGSQKKPVINVDDGSTLGFRRISPVADTPPPSTPIGSPSAAAHYDYDTFKHKASFSSSSNARTIKQQRGSKLSAGPVFPPSDPASSDSIILRPRRPLPEQMAPNWKRSVVMLSMRPEWVTAAKMLLFLVKVGTLSGSCTPVGVKPWIYYPLMGLAGFDFSRSDPTVTIVLTIVHFVVLGLVHSVGRVCLY
ncbi:uncharacterized protein LAJ45_09809 [Morchella importuna]|uniref:uncharacterized protein n=1 Tax=Morchella importuna TaxID=1174673 RepID=UPI001E8EE1B0|nr:uncharacterized protein LAJ45_09809 [Morchella importuna]KAH8146119.1 hypothetical protein LAJ45_09809 [Morchella importuna]